MSDLAGSIVRIAEEAGNAILTVYNRAGEIQVSSKQDASPLTEADLIAHETIRDELLGIDETIPIVSEEGRIGNPLESEKAWLVDPLDGTKEFIKRNGMFTVNIALMARDNDRWTPLLGVVHAPVTKTTWVGGSETPPQRIADGNYAPIQVNKETGQPIRLVASGSHRGEKDESFAESLGNHDLIRMGSSLKACIVAEGGADLYPRFGPTSCWDIAAAHAIVEAAGGLVVGPDATRLDYDIVDEVLNPYFLVACSDDWNAVWQANQG